MTEQPVVAEDGFTTPALALVLALLILALAGVSIDLWRVIGAHQRLVAVTDAAAVAGTGGIDVEQLYLGVTDLPVLEREAATNLACAYLMDRAVVHGCPGPDAAVVVESDAITVATRVRVSLSLLRLLLPAGGGSPEIEIAATATAAPLRISTTEP